MAEEPNRQSVSWSFWLENDTPKYLNWFTWHSFSSPLTLRKPPCFWDHDRIKCTAPYPNRSGRSQPCKRTSMHITRTLELVNLNWMQPWSMILATPAITHQCVCLHDHVECPSKTSNHTMYSLCTLQARHSHIQAFLVLMIIQLKWKLGRSMLGIK